MLNYLNMINHIEFQNSNKHKFDCYYDSDSTYLRVDIFRTLVNHTSSTDDYRLTLKWNNVEA